MDYTLVTQHIVKTQNIGVNNNLFGGDMLRWIDEAGAIYASTLIGQSSKEQPNLLTLKVSEVLFKVQVKEKSLVVMYAGLKKAGKTSLTVGINVVNKFTEEELVSCEIIFINVDKDGKPKPHDL